MWKGFCAIRDGSKPGCRATLQAAADAPEPLAGASDVSLVSLGTLETFEIRGSGRRGGTRADLTLGDDMVFCLSSRWLALACSLTGKTPETPMGVAYQNDRLNLLFTMIIESEQTDGVCDMNNLSPDHES